MLFNALAELKYENPCVKDGGTCCQWEVQILEETKILSDFFRSILALVDKVTRYMLLVASRYPVE